MDEVFLPGAFKDAQFEGIPVLDDKRRQIGTVVSGEETEDGLQIIVKIGARRGPHNVPTMSTRKRLRREKRESRRRNRG